MNIFEAYNYLIESEDTGRLKKIFARYELFKKTISVPGDIIECGVFKGTGHIFWLKLLKIFDEHSIKKVIGFDSFENFSDSILEYEKKEQKKFVKEANYTTNISVKEINKKINKLGLIKRSELIKGDIITTAKKYVKNNKGFKISLLNLDLDTYEGTKSALNEFYKKISRGGIIVLDEYGKRGWGETDAVDEFIDNHKELEIKTIKYSNQPTAYIVKKF
ncbi:TylF/MycF/NovP-related O-methyltransferase [Candidatus Pelagibacter sp. HIMB1587]|uniref:TylF/MycF/NovP-related O-methyltransferase n=1 Tax=Candidatus Pelagibacter sp. HIMB1587 TaxID=3413354 RepID=UPI003F877E34